MYRMMLNPRKLLMLMLIGTSIFGLIEGSHEDSSSAECNMSLNLTDAGLNSLPEGFVKQQYLTQLILDGNQISSVSPETFSFAPKLSYLSLANNKLKNLNLHLFSKLPNLDTLILNGNCKRTMTRTRIQQPSDIDEYNSDNNNRYDYDYQYRRNYHTTTPPLIEQFCTLQFDARLASLTHLFLENNDLKDLAFTSGELPVLTNLHLSHNPLVLNHNTMSGLSRFAPALTHIYLRHCGISSFHAAQLPTVTSLYLDGNLIVSICNEPFEASFLNLFEARSLETLSVSHNKISKIEVDSFAYTINLVNLDLSHNNILVIRNGTFDKLYRLQSLSLEQNRLLQLGEVDTFKDLIRLESLFLGGIDVSNIPSSFFKNMSTLKHLILDNTKISTIDSDVLSPLTSIEVLSLASNELSVIPEGFLPKSGSMTTLNLDRNAFTSTDNISLTNETHMMVLSLRDNPLTSITAQWITDVGSENLTIILGVTPPQ